MRHDDSEIAKWRLVLSSHYAEHPVDMNVLLGTSWAAPFSVKVLADATKAIEDCNREIHDRLAAKYLAVACSIDEIEKSLKPPSAGKPFDFPHLWELIAFALPKKTKERVFGPAFEDMKAQLIESQSERFDATWTRRYLFLCFTFRTVVMVADCLRVFAKAAIVGAILSLIPTFLKVRFPEFLLTLFPPRN